MEAVVIAQRPVRASRGSFHSGNIVGSDRIGTIGQAIDRGFALNREIVGAALRLLRKRKGVRQQDLAKKLVPSVNPSQVSRVENGQIHLSPERRDQWIEALGASHAEFNDIMNDLKDSPDEPDRDIDLDDQPDIYEVEIADDRLAPVLERGVVARFRSILPSELEDGDVAVITPELQVDGAKKLGVTDWGKVKMHGDLVVIWHLGDWPPSIVKLTDIVRAGKLTSHTTYHD